jgi:hypothetical protein
LRLARRDRRTHPRANRASRAAGAKAGGGYGRDRGTLSGESVSGELLERLNDQPPLLVVRSHNCTAGRDPAGVDWPPHPQNQWNMLLLASANKPANILPEAASKVSIR